MTSMTKPAPGGRQTLRFQLSVTGLLGLGFVLPMIGSGFVFQTYDIAMPTLPLEMARQFNCLFLLAEAAIIALALGRGHRPLAGLAGLDRQARIALGIFVATFWIGGTFMSRAAGFATLFNLTFPLHLLFGCAVWVMASSALPHDRDPAAVARIAFAGLAVFAAMTLVRFAYPPPGRPLETIVWQFAIPGFISLRLFGACVAPFVALTAWLALTRGQETAYRRWVFLALGLSFGLVFWSATRAALLALGVVGAMAAILFRPQVPRAILARAALAIVGGVAVALMLIPYGDPTFMLFAPGDLANADSASGGRLTYWHSVWTAYQSFPLFGAGPGATAWAPPSDQFKHIQPHNIFLQFLITWGAFAAAAALYLIGRAIRAAHRIAKHEARAIGWLLFADTLMVISLFDGTFHFAQPLMMWSGAMAMVFSWSKAPARRDLSGA